MKKKAYLYILFSITFLLCNQANASATEWKVDPAHSGIYFRITHIYSSVNGFFPEFEGDIEFDPSNLKESRFAFKVKVKSIDTNNSKRDNHLMSKDFFDADKYPEMTFESKSITHMGANNYQVEGTFTIKDVSKAMTLPFIFFGSKQHPLNKKIDVAGFEARMNIDRLGFNIGDGGFYKKGVVGKEVDVLITIEATRER